MLQVFQTSPSNMHLVLDFEVCNTVQNLWYPELYDPEYTFNRKLNKSPLHFTELSAGESCS